MDKIIEGVVFSVGEELRKSMTKWSLFNSRHEGYAVLLEEVDELWDEVKKRKPDVKNMRAEAVQVAAMAMKFIMSMENEWRTTEIGKPKPQASFIGGSNEDLLKFETKCRYCLYDVMKKEELAMLGYDPCDTCGDDCCNWKPKEVE